MKDAAVLRLNCINPATLLDLISDDSYFFKKQDLYLMIISLQEKL